jgi:hypothetical protein
MTLKARKLKTDTRKRVIIAELILFNTNDNANSCQKHVNAEKTALHKYNGYTLMSQWRYPLVEQFDQKHSPSLVLAVNNAEFTENICYMKRDGSAG